MCRAPANVAPAVMPAKIPSFVARPPLHRSASALAISRMRSITPVSTASLVSFGMKSGVQPCIGCGLNAGWAPARGAVRVTLLRFTVCEQRRVGRLTDNDPGDRTLLRQNPRHTLQFAARSIARHPVVERLAGGIIEDLSGRRARVHVGIGFVLEVASKEPAMRPGEFDGLCRHAHAACCRRSPGCSGIFVPCITSPQSTTRATSTVADGLQTPEP